MAAPLTLTDPCAVSEYLLARTGEAYMVGDFDSFAACFALPQWIETFKGRSLIATPDELQALFNAVRSNFYRLGVTDLVRRCVAAEFRDPDTIEATHETRLLSGARLVQPSYPCFSVIKRTEQGWLVAGGQYAIQDALEIDTAPLGAASASSHSSHTGV
jgi:hypothetical protein